MVKLKNLIASASLVLAPVVAMAATTIDIKYLSTTGTVVNTTQTSDYLSGAMSYLTSTGTSFEAFCAELGQGHALTSAGFQTYTVGSFGGNQADMLQRLYSSSYASLATAQQKAAFQTAVWEITHENASTLGATTGSFQFKWLTDTSTTAEDNAFASLVNGYLNDAKNYTGDAKYTLTKLSSDTYQDLVTISAVPEPESYALLLAGLGVVVFVARRRQRA